MRRLTTIILVICCVIPFHAQKKEDARLKESYDVLKEILATPDKGIPRDLLNKSACVVVFPSVKKAAFLVGGSYGRGIITCRSGEKFHGPWSAPAMFAMEGASFGPIPRKTAKNLLTKPQSTEKNQAEFETYPPSVLLPGDR